MSMKLSAEEAAAASEILARVDRIASEIQANHKSWGMAFEAARPLVQSLDKLADDLETRFFGASSLQRRQIEVLKTAKVIQQDSDEPYMKTFNSPMAPLQTDADEPYMSAYGDDQSQAVQVGKSETGRALAP
jgi:hypothetical protein